MMFMASNIGYNKMGPSPSQAEGTRLLIWRVFTPSQVQILPGPPILKGSKYEKRWWSNITLADTQFSSV